MRHSPPFIQHEVERGPGLRYVEKFPTGSSPGDGTHLRCPGHEAERCCPCCPRRACGCPEPPRPADRAVARATRPDPAITTREASCTKPVPPSSKPRACEHHFRFLRCVPNSLAPASAPTMGSLLQNLSRGGRVGAALWCWTNVRGLSGLQCPSWVARSLSCSPGIPGLGGRTALGGIMVSVLTESFLLQVWAPDELVGK